MGFPEERAVAISGSRLVSSGKLQPGARYSYQGAPARPELADGTTVTIGLTGSTTCHTESAGSSSDVKVGSKVQAQIDTGSAASETPNPSGGRTLTASDILVDTP